MKEPVFREIFPSIVEFPNVVQNCEEIINLALSFEPLWRDAQVGIGSDLDTRKNIRSNRILDLFSDWDHPIQWFRLNQTVWQYAKIYSATMKASFVSMDDLQLLHYQSKDDFYHEHSDDGIGLSRIFSALLYLNDVEEGGETYFKKFDITIKPEAGKLVFFPANYAFSHEARPPIVGEKFVAVTWFSKEEKNNES
jgi:hypothetical protein